MFVVLRLQDGCEGMNTLKVVLCEECTPRVQPLTLQSQLITKYKHATYIVLRGVLMWLHGRLHDS